MSRVRVNAVFALMLIAASARAQQAPAPFQDGQKIVFTGDSITHGGWYPYYVQLFYATRFPERKVTILNAGINGDTATGCLRRLDEDILAVKPNQVYMMFGMNDVGRGNYKTATPDEKTQAAREASLAAYRKALTENVQRIKAAGAQPVLITPSPHDQYSESADKTHLAVTGNDGLARCAQIVRDLAAAEQCPMVDLHGPITSLMLKNPEWALAGKDRVHPDPKGHMVMAYFVLQAQKIAGAVAKAAVDYAAKQALPSENCRVDGVEAGADLLKFNYRANSLPFPMSDEFKAAAEIVPWEALNQEILQVKNLPAGEYRLRVGGAEVGRFSADQFAAGVNIAGLQTPQQQKAQKLREAITKRHTADAPLRNRVWIEHSYLRPNKIDPADTKAVDQFFDQYPANKRAAWFDWMVKSYREQRGKEKELAAQAQAAQEEVFGLQTTESYPVEIGK